MQEIVTDDAFLLRTWTSAMRVALISTAREWYGGEEQARLLARGLRDAHHEVFPFGLTGSPFVRRMAAEQFETVSFSRHRWDPAAWWKLRSEFRRLRPDVLHFNDARAISTAGRAAAMLPIPARIASRRVAFPIRWAGKYRAFCDRVLCVSRFVADESQRCGVPSRMLRTVFDGSDPARPRGGDRRRTRESFGLTDDQIMLLVVASLNPMKGHADLLNAMPRVLERRPNVRLYVVGDGPLAGAISHQAIQSGLESRVTFTGYRNDIPDLLAACDLFVMPSRSEGMCSSLIEAMLAERPLVTTTAGGIQEIVGDGSEDGPVAWTSPPNDPDELAAALLTALARRDQWASRSQAALRRATRLFTAQRMVAATIQQYEEVLAAKSITVRQRRRIAA